jgi:nucleotide-binding universal stress UspA family protein
MGDRLLLCLDASRAALAAARLAIDIVGRHGGRIRAVCVTADEGEELAGAAHALLARVEAMATDRRIPIETVLAHGDPARRILEAADSWRPDLILIGRAGRRGPGSPVLGGNTLRVLEFSEWPVLVVPETAETPVTPDPPSTIA